MEINVRDATEADLPAIVEIYNQSIPGAWSTADTRPVTVAERIEWFHKHDSARRPLWVAEMDGQIAAWIGLTSFYAGRPAYDATAEVSLYIALAFQRRGIGTYLKRRMIEHCPRLGVTTLVSMHFDHNEATRRINQHLGFSLVGHLPEIAVVNGEPRGLIISLLRIAPAPNAKMTAAVQVPAADGVSDPLQLFFAEIDPEQHGDAVAAFLSGHAWPFHARSKLSVDEARQVKLGPPDQVRAFWVRNDELPVGVVRIFDLEDAAEGSVLIDIRIATEWRGRGIGRATIAWVVEMLFTEYPSLHRIQAATRVDNHAMRRVLEINKFVPEGRLRETWRSDDGTRHDTALYGRLRSDF